uniref:Protein PTCD3 homolog, mitochondrial n=1 Tax=Haemonchus contortus TaxID=6289 RepID=A0A7I4XWP1_HAECO|nr:Protein Y110A7A.19 [Haemonchus contortus]
MLRLRARFSTNLFRQLATEAAQEDKTPRVVIPPAVKRGPTDMLRALSETVGVDPTAPHFGFIDDPAMIPSTASAKRTYYMAKEMGKRAARQLAEEWPTLFALDRDDPYLPAFRPQKPADPLQVAPTEENILSMIEKREVEDAARLYERMRAENIDVSLETQMELFKLVTYYNGKNVPFSEWEEWHGMRAFGENEPNKWTSAGLADLLFEVLPHTPEVVSTYIAGLIKFATSESAARANELHKEFASKEVLCREAYDALISAANWKDAKALLKEMAEKKVKPVASTWNALLQSAKQMNGLTERLSAFENVIGEMVALKIQPSLETYRIILNSIEDSIPENTSKDAEKKADTILSVGISWLSEMLSDLETRPSLELCSTKDHLFFLDAMGIAYQAGNMEIAERLVKLYENPVNKVKLPALPTEGIFYNRYLLLFIERTTSIEGIEKKYKELVPRLVGVSRQLSLAVAEKLKHSPRWTLLRRLIEDGICARQLVDFRVAPILRNLLIDVHYQALSVEHRQEYADLIRRTVDISVEFSRFTDERQKRLQFKLSPSNISECALLLNRIGDSQRAYELLELLLDPDASEGDEATVLNTGYAKHSAMMEIFEDALREKDPYKAATCIEIMSNTLPRNKLEPLVQRVQDRCKLTADQERILTGFVRLRPQ